MSRIKILEELGNNKFIVEIPNNDMPSSTTELVVAHDYIGFKNTTYTNNKDGSCNFNIRIPQYIQIGIREIIDIILPLLNNHKYCQQEHLKYTNKEGKIVDNYTWATDVIGYYNSELNQYMYAVRMPNETTFNHVTEEFFNKWIKPNLK